MIPSMKLGAGRRLRAFFKHALRRLPAFWLCMLRTLMVLSNILSFDATF
jgi:hypothetical protein